MSNTWKSSTDRCQITKCPANCADYDILPTLDLKNANEFGKPPTRDDNANSQCSQREWMLSQQLAELECQTNCFKEKLAMVIDERNKLLEANTVAMNERKELDAELDTLRQEVRQYKYKEVRLLTHYDALEEENANLHKQLADMRKAQVDSEIKNRREMESARKKKCSKHCEDNSSQEVQRLLDVEQLEEEVARLKILIVTKGEQVTTLREVLNSTRKTYEDAIKNMKLKHESDKQALVKENKDLRDEVKTLKDKKVITLTSGHESLHQYQDILKQFEECEKEKRTLMQMLYTAQEQKLCLARKLECQIKSKTKLN